ncbi:hypothetical protein HY029_01975 [Candidatus Gottesmanbacteria bacterium]|nr:hypothetical protein [Candidatus Gottesmanbacteria bacterium]
MRRRLRDRKTIFNRILFWITFIGYIAIIEPASIISFLGFYLLLALTIFFTLKSFLSIVRTLVWIIIIILYLLFRQFHLENILNTILLIGIFITFEIYFRES